MKSIERRFSNVKERNPSWSSYICFAAAVEGQRFGRQAIHRWFHKLVDKTDYMGGEKRGILEHLVALTNTVRATRIGAKKPLRKDYLKKK